MKAEQLEEAAWAERKAELEHRGNFKPAVKRSTCKLECIIFALLVLTFIGIVLLGFGCVATGDWKYELKTPLGDWSISGTEEPPKAGDPPTVLTFDDWFKKWWEGLWAPAAKLGEGESSAVIAVEATTTEPTP